MADPVRLDDDSLERLSKMINSNRGSSSSSPTSSSVNESTRTLNSANNSLAKEAETLANRFTKGTESAGGLIDTFKTYTNFGVNFNNDSLAFRDSIARTRMSTTEYGSVIEKLIPNITSLGGTVTDGAKRFGQMSKEFSETSAADQLRQIGYTTKEYNDVLALSLAGRKNIDFQDAQSRQKANMAAADLALEMDKVAQLTGVSRQEQQRTLQEKQGNARVQAAIEQQVRAGGADAAAAYQKMAVQMRGLGLDKLSDEIYSGQALSQKSIAQLNALGPAGNQLRDAINQVRNATDKESRARADAALREAQAAVARQVTSDQSLNQIRYGQGETAEALGEISISARNYANGINEEKERARKAGKEIGDDEAARNLEKRARFAQDLASGKAEEDAKKAVAAAKTDAEKAEAAAKLKEVERAKMEAKPTEALILILNRLNDTLRDATSTAIAAGKGITGSQTGQAVLGGVIKGAQQGGIVPTGAVDAINKAIAAGDWKAAGVKIAEGFVASAKNLYDLGKETAQNVGKAAAAPDRPRYAEGTAGAGFDVGKLIQDFGTKTTVDLHGKEAVVTEDQLKKLVNGVMSGSMVSTRQTTTETSTSGGGETTTTRKQSDASKAAEQELADLWQKFGTDWQKRKEVLIEGMAVEDRKFSKVQAAMKGDAEAQRIKEEYEAKRAELQKKVDDGISYEIETKQAATEKLTELQKTVTDNASYEIETKQAATEKLKELAITSQNDLESIALTGNENIVKQSQESVTQKTKIEKDGFQGFNIEGLFGPVKKAFESVTGFIKAPDASQVRGLSKTIPNEIAQAKIEATKKATVPEPVSKPEPKSAIPQATTTLDDLKEQLIQLNKTMGEMVSHSSEMVGNIEKQVRATKRLDPNVSLRG